MTTERLYSISEVAIRIGVSYETLRRWIEKGAVEAVRVGPDGTIRIPERTLQTLINIYSPPTFRTSRTSRD